MDGRGYCRVSSKCDGWVKGWEYSKYYINDNKKDSKLIITEDEFEGHRSETAAMWGYRDFWGNFKPDLLNPELQTIEIEPESFQGLWMRPDVPDS